MTNESLIRTPTSPRWAPASFALEIVCAIAFLLGVRHSQTSLFVIASYYLVPVLALVASVSSVSAALEMRRPVWLLLGLIAIAIAVATMYYAFVCCTIAH